MFCSVKLLTQILSIFYLSSYVTSVHSANILGLFTSPSASHLIVHMSVAKILAENGHNVTIVVTQKPKVNHDKIHTILIPPSAEQQNILDKALSEILSKPQSIWTTLGNFMGSLRVLIDMQVDVFKDERVARLYNNQNPKFDLVILGYFFNTYQLGVASKLKVPSIVIWTSSPMLTINSLIGNPEELSYVPGMNIVNRSPKKMSFIDRTKNLLTAFLFRTFFEVIEYRMANFYRSLFSNDERFPDYADSKKNVSLMFCNSHFSEGIIRPNVPALVEIGGIQIKEFPDPLPKDVENILNNSSHYGAILFSLGSNVKSSNLRNETVQRIFNVLSNLKQNVIWKWEDLTTIPGQSHNILYKQWLPQDDILAHPNLKLFITHAGKGGFAESLYHGVPMVALPIFADQHSNADKIVNAVYGKKLDLTTISEDLFKKTILEVLNNSTYVENVQYFARLYKDRPLSARQSVVYWTDYILRYKGAPHIQSPLIHMNFIEYLNIDVIIFLGLVLFLLVKIIMFLMNFIILRLFTKSVKVKSH